MTGLLDEIGFNKKKGAKFLVRESLHGDFVNAILAELQGDNPRVTYLREHLLSKFANPDPKQAESRRKAAIEKMMAVEERNAATNTRLFLGDWSLCPEDPTPEQLFKVGDRTMADVMRHARDLIKGVIGVTVPLVLLKGGFSGGASTSKRRGPGMVARKYSKRPDCTPEAWDTIWPQLIGAKTWLEGNPWLLEPRFVPGSVHFTVPKSDTIDRNACKEPDLNMYFQKAVGNFIRHRLRKRAKINLNDQTINQLYAKQAWGNGLATVDLSSASDSVSIQLVQRLLPTEWFYYMDALRSKGCTIDGSEHTFSMFSSMGNGFTFELESLIFWALATATACSSPEFGLSRTVSVYGDDLIIHKKMFHRLRRVLSYCGFTVNTKKSHFSGPIRESCGKHYHQRTDITPFFIREPITNVERLIKHLNAIRRWSTEGRTYGCDLLYDVWQRFAAHVPKHLHGGWDVQSVQTLASPKGQAKRLVREKEPRKVDAQGAYLMWLDQAELATSQTPKQYQPGDELFWWEPRTREAFKVSEESVDTFFIRGRQPVWGRTCPRFTSEWSLE